MLLNPIISEDKKMSIKRLTALSLTLCFALNFLITSGIPVYAAEIETQTYYYENYTVDFTVKSAKENSQTVDIFVTNISSETMYNWAFEFDAGGEISSVSNGEIHENSGSIYIIKSTAKNAEIKSGETVNFSYTVKGSNLTPPQSFLLVSKRVVLTAGYSVSIKSNANKKTDFEASITLKNTAKNPSGNNGKNNDGTNTIDAWTVSFDANFTLENVDESTFTADGNGRYTINSSSGNNRIAPNNTVEVKISGTKTPNIKPAISNITVTAVKISAIGETPDPYSDTDTDGDGLTDYEESILQTDKTKPDTDMDGLTDFEEIYYTGTDPLVYDSITTGTSDGEADSDNDTLSNRTEIDIETNPANPDTDYDSLNDGEEINTYKTDPKSADTDGDKVPDNDEIELGLNPNSASTDGIPDAERTIEQTISAESDVMNYINSESDLKYSIEITSAGVAENNLTVNESGYSAVMQNSATIGIIPEFTYTDGLTVTDFTIAAKISENLTENKIGTYATENPEFEGIKRLNFFRFFEEINTLLPVETTFDISQNMMYTKTDELGTYCVMDMEIWLESLAGGFEDLIEAETETDKDTDENSSEISLLSAGVMQEEMYLASKTDIIKRIDEDEEFNVIFYVDIRETINDESNKFRVNSYFDYVNKTLEKLKFEYGDRVSVDLYTSNGLANPDNSGRYSAQYSENKSCDPFGFLFGMQNIKFPRMMNKTFYFFLLNENEIITTKSNAEEVLKVYVNSDKNDSVSLISDLTKYSNTGFFVNLITQTDGTIINLSHTEFNLWDGIPSSDINKNKINAVSNKVMTYLDSNYKEAYRIISSVGLTVLPTDFNEENVIGYYSEYLWNKGKYLKDTDGDGLNNHEEIDFKSKLIIKLGDSIVLPTVKDCIYNSEYSYVVNGFDRFVENTKASTSMEFWSIADSTYILPILSDPTMIDGDEDGYSDYDEVRIHDSQPLVCNLVQAYLKGGYINVRSFVNNNSYYGGNQSWFGNTDKLSDLKAHQLVRGGCGVIAVSDTLLYLQKYNNDVYTPININNDEINGTEYENFVADFSKNYITPIDIYLYTDPVFSILEQFSQSFDDKSLILYLVKLWNENYTKPITGYISNDAYTWGTTLDLIKKGFNSYMDDNDGTYYMDYKYAFELNRDKYEEDIVIALKNNTPPILMFGYPLIKFTSLNYNEIDSDGNLIPGEIKNAHFMTITGIRKDDITGETTLILSSWGDKIQIDLDEYINNSGLLGGIAFIERIGD
jgi:hypothetical protein